MAYIRKRKLPSGKTRWQVIWDTEAGPVASVEDDARQRGSAMFDSHAEAKAKLEAIQRDKPKTSAPLSDLTKHFLKHFEDLVAAGQRERSSLRQYKQHINNHVLVDRQFAVLKCGDIDTVTLQLFLDRLALRVSYAMATKIRTSLSRVFDHGKRRGFVTFNPISGTKIERTRRPKEGAQEHFELPPKADLKELLRAAKRYDNNGRADAVVRTLMFAGLRISELRGLFESCCKLTNAISNLKVSRRADQFNKLGPVKSAAGLRTIEIGQETAGAIKAYVAARTVEADLVFPNEEGNVWSYSNFWNRFWVPLMNAAGLVTDEEANEASKYPRGKRSTRKPSSSKAALAAKDYRERLRSAKDKIARAERDEKREIRQALKQPAFGPHMLRHVYASLQIDQGVTPKRLQKLMGHSTLKLTLDTYGHLWPDESEDRARARNVERTL